MTLVDDEKFADDLWIQSRQKTKRSSKRKDSSRYSSKENGLTTSCLTCVDCNGTQRRAWITPCPPDRIAGFSAGWSSSSTSKTPEMRDTRSDYFTGADLHGCERSLLHDKIDWENPRDIEGFRARTKVILQRARRLRDFNHDLAEELMCRLASEDAGFLKRRVNSAMRSFTWEGNAEDESAQKALLGDSLLCCKFEDALETARTIEEQNSKRALEMQQEKKKLKLEILRARRKLTGLRNQSCTCMDGEFIRADVLESLAREDPPSESGWTNLLGWNRAQTSKSPCASSAGYVTPPEASARDDTSSVVSSLHDPPGSWMSLPYSDGWSSAENTPTHRRSRGSGRGSSDNADAPASSLFAGGLFDWWNGNANHSNGTPARDEDRGSSDPTLARESAAQRVDLDVLRLLGTRLDNQW